MVRIRMKSFGRRHRPFFRICAMDARSPRDGRSIEELGHYDPMVRNKDARTVLDKYLTDPNAGSTGKVGGGWRCPHPYNEEQGKCTNKKKSASFKYKNGYGGT